MAGSLDDAGKVKIFDAHDLALWITIDKSGRAEAESRVDKREAARLVRILADRWDAAADAAEAAT